MIGRENGVRFLSKSQGPSTLKKNHNLKEKSCSGCQWWENGCEQDFKLLLLLANYDWSIKGSKISQRISKPSNLKAKQTRKQDLGRLLAQRSTVLKDEAASSVVS